MIIFTVLKIIKLNHKTPLIMDTNSVEIFYIIDEFCKEIEKTMEGHLLTMKISKVISLMPLKFKKNVLVLKIGKKFI